jgi:hypothetical protein
MTNGGGKRFVGQRREQFDYLAQHGEITKKNLISESTFVTVPTIRSCSNGGDIKSGGPHWASPFTGAPTETPKRRPAADHRVIRFIAKICCQSNEERKS